MQNSPRKLYVSASDSNFSARLHSVALELNFEIRWCSRETILEHAQEAECFITEFSSFAPDSAEFLSKWQEAARPTPMIVIVGSHSPSDIGRFMRRGVLECLAASSTVEDIQHALELAVEERKRIGAGGAPATMQPWRRQLVGESEPMAQIGRIIQLVAARRCTVLITGETGTGKEVAARAIHQASDRARRPMVSINCGAIPEDLIEAELFGHVKGAFTGAIANRTGRFEQASGGTLFLDEIGDLPLDLQAKLLRVLQEREIQRLGSSETIKVDVRVIAATNADLGALVHSGRFREDLYYRLNVVPLQMPALRERAEDIPLLVDHFIQKICGAEDLPMKQVSREALGRLSEYSWPGNVRQLENVVENAVVMSGDRTDLYVSDFALPKAVQPLPQATSIRVPGSHMPDEGLDYTEALRQFERAILQQALSKARGNKSLAADMLRLPRTTLLHKLRILEHAAA